MIQAYKEDKETGFTLVEVTYAIVILAGSLVILTGLITSVAERSIYDDNRKYAMHYARQILAAIETIEASATPLEDQNTTEPAQELLERLIGNVPQVRSEDSAPPIDLQAELIVSPWGIPNVANDLMKKIELTLFWSDDPRDQFSTVFFVPIP